MKPYMNLKSLYKPMLIVCFSTSVGIMSTQAVQAAVVYTTPGNSTVVVPTGYYGTGYRNGYYYGGHGYRYGTGGAYRYGGGAYHRTGYYHGAGVYHGGGYHHGGVYHGGGYHRAGGYHGGHRR